MANRCQERSDLRTTHPTMRWRGCCHIVHVNQSICVIRLQTLPSVGREIRKSISYLSGHQETTEVNILGFSSSILLAEDSRSSCVRMAHEKITPVKCYLLDSALEIHASHDLYSIKSLLSHRGQLPRSKKRIWIGVSIVPFVVQSRCCTGEYD